MIISNDYTWDHIVTISGDLTPEAYEQAQLYGILGYLPDFLLDSCMKSKEVYTVTHNDTPVALCGVTWTQEYVGDFLWLVVTQSAINNYREFSRTCKEWLSGREYPVVSVIPAMSQRTLRMVLKWGFKPTGEAMRDGITHVVLTKYPERGAK